MQTHEQVSTKSFGEADLDGCGTAQTMLTVVILPYMAYSLAAGLRDLQNSGGTMSCRGRIGWAG